MHDALFQGRLRETRTRIGRADDCDIVLPDNEVSRSHCVIDRTESGWELQDRSSNGTWLNGEKVMRSALKSGDWIKLGPFAAVFEYQPKEMSVPTEEPQPEVRHEQIDAAGETLEVRTARLVINSGPGAGERIALRGARFSVGGPGSKVVLPDSTLARDHVRIRLVAGRAMVEPGQGAAFIGNERIRDITPLVSGEEVRIGRIEFTVEWHTDQEQPTSDRFGEMVGHSEAMRKVFGMLRRVAAHHAPVLLLGESGTGKELAARAVHDASPRAGRPFVPLNCGAINANLFESELFGHEKGSFTGAADRRDGAFHRAEGGTLFLDEIGELPEEAQAKLLRSLETGEVRRVGGAEISYPDVRVVAATNRDLAAMVQARTFRSDLYFRLAVLSVRLPPLRERPDDVPMIAEAVARRIHPSITVTKDALAALSRYAWPGNAREIRNVLTRAYVMHGPVIDTTNLIFQELERPPAEVPVGTLEEAEKQLVLDALRRARGNRTAAARMLGVPRTTLLYKMGKWGIGEPSSYA